MLMQAIIAWFDLAAYPWSVSLATPNRKKKKKKYKDTISRWLSVWSPFGSVSPIKHHNSLAQTSVNNNQDFKCVWHELLLCPTCGTEGNEGLDMFAYKCQLILGQRQPPHNVLDEIVWRYCCQVPLQLPQHHQFPLLERERERRRGRVESRER